MDVSGFTLMLGLGLRHGLDPDHIALIDSMALRAAERRPAMTPWVGTWFALGHGLVVTLIAVGVAMLAGQIHLPERWLMVTDWLPVLLLLLVGISNLRALRAGQRLPASASLRLAVLPRPLRSVYSPLGILLVGAIFAAIFDTITQAAAWGYVATQQSGVTGALVSGAVFTLGMLITDTLDSRLMSRALLNAAPDTTARYRRRMGWWVVSMSFAVVAYVVLSALFPALTLSDELYSLLGALMVAVVACFYIWLWWLGRCSTGTDFVRGS